MAALRSALASLEPGDIILSGGNDPFSRLVQWGTDSRFSHVAVAISDGWLIESYDYTLRPSETEEGVYLASTGYYYLRTMQSTNVSDIMILRPSDFDRSRFDAAVSQLLAASPSFPTVGVGLIALCGLSVPALRRLPSGLARRITEWQVKITVDGTGRMHCAEMAARLLQAAGLRLRFDKLTLEHHHRQLCDMRGTAPQLPWPSARRTPDRAKWYPKKGAGNKVRNAVLAAQCVAHSMADRLATPAEVGDANDLVVPADFEYARPFTTVAELKYNEANWWLKQSGGDLPAA